MDKKSYAHGEPCWADLGTTDAAAAKAFYGALFGWTFADQPSSDGTSYTMARLGGAAVAAIYDMPPEERQHAPSHWNLYVSVRAVDEVAARVAGLGGKIVAGPFDVMEHGRMALVADPSGAVLSLWQARQHTGAARWAEPGALCWIELMTRDLDGAGRFWSGLLGWGAKPSPEYTEWTVAGQSVGGMMRMMPESGEMPPSWTGYFEVADADATVKQARALGGKVLVPAMDIDRVGRFAVLADPTGAAFAIIKLTR